MNLETKTVLITGASGGLGEVLAKSFAREKVNVIIHYYENEDKAEMIKDETCQYNVECMTVKADISNETDVKNMLNLIINKFSKIDILVNNASISNDDDFFNKDINISKRILEVNAIGTYLVSREVGKLMLENQRGNIINISSNNGIDSGYIESVDYDMSKSSIISLTHNLAKALSPNIRVNCIAPGWIDTDINKDMSEEFKKAQTDKCLLNRFAKKEEIANVVLFLASDKSSYVNDAIIKVDGGIK